MGIRTEWADDSQQILYFYVEAPWTWEEYRAKTDQVFSQIRSVNHLVGTVVVAYGIKTWPRGNVIQHLQYVEAFMPPNVCASVVVGASYLVTAVCVLNGRSHRIDSAAFRAGAPKQARQIHESG
jgi:hypothetical protein